MITTERAFTLFLIAFVLFFLGLGAFHYEYRWVVFRFPLLVGGAAVIFATLHLFHSTGKTAESEAPAAAEGPPQAGPRAAAIGMLWVVAVVPFLLVFGYVVGLPLYVLTYLKTHGQGWAASIVLALGALAVVWLGFVVVLRVPMEILPPWLA